ncbi:hypothetical protein LCGC14_3016570 [marine sediment metagenome]|uniref:Uncharacterized protein n=1 Tax=marine sediment metagenome TaxID=412755 RepID=A0A0F8ZMQ0_9ZZZZ
MSDLTTYRTVDVLTDLAPEERRGAIFSGDLTLVPDTRLRGITSEHIKTYQTTVTIGSATDKNVHDLAQFVSDYVPGFTIRQGLGYWQGKLEPSVDFIHIGSDVESKEFVWALTYWALGDNPVSSMSEECVLVTRTALDATLIYKDKEEIL